MANFGYTLTGKGVTLFFGAKPVPVDNTHLNYDEIIKELKKGESLNVELLKELSDIPKKINGLLYGDVVVGDDGIIYYKGKPVHNYLADKIISMLKEGWDISIWANFLNNLLQNPSEVAVKELYLFLEKADMPLTPDGHFLAFKKVNHDYTSIHDGKTDNSIGSKPSMPRESVDADRHRTCSAGLHFCAHDYLTHFGNASSSRVIIVKINPADVVAIPSDYENAKGRAWTYEVVGEIDNPGDGPRDKSFNKVVDDRWDAPEEVTIDDTYTEEQVEVMNADRLKEVEASEKLFGGKYTAAQILAKVREVGSIRGAGRALGIAKSTFGDWVNEAKKVPVTETDLDDVVTLSTDILEIISNHLGVEAKLSNRLSRDLGADSLDALEIVMTIEDTYGVEISDEEADSMIDATVQEMIDFAIKKINNK